MKHKLHHGDAEARSFRSSTKIHSAAVLILFLLISVPCVSGEQPSTVEFAALVANPIQFNGKLIEVKGFLVQRFENSALYADRKWQYGSNSVWITASSELHTSLRDFDHHYVVVTGVFNANDHGHMENFKGLLTVKKFHLAQGNGKPVPK